MALSLNSTFSGGLDLIGFLPTDLKGVLSGGLKESKVCILLRDVWLVVIGIFRKELIVCLYRTLSLEG